jgi:hypothetical protein
MQRRRWKVCLRLVRLQGSDRRHGGLCCGRSAAIKPCAFGAPLRQDGLRKVRFALDSALEGGGFELPVPD